MLIDDAVDDAAERAGDTVGEMGAGEGTRVGATCTRDRRGVTREVFVIVAIVVAAMIAAPGATRGGARRGAAVVLPSELLLLLLVLVALQPRWRGCGRRAEVRREAAGEGARAEASCWRAATRAPAESDAADIDRGPEGDEVVL